MRLAFDTRRLRPQRLSGAVTEDYGARLAVFSQGDRADTLFHIVKGRVALSAVSPQGKEVIIVTLGNRAFFGEPCLVGQRVRLVTARTVVPSTLVRIPRQSMVRALSENPAFAAQFATYVLRRYVRLEDDLMNHLFNSSEKRLARVLITLAQLGQDGATSIVVPKVSQGTLASMVGVTRERVSRLMNKFRRLGFIDYNDDTMHVHSALLRLLSSE